MSRFRYYQEEADTAIYEELLINNKCIVKMFCGTGKSLLMRKCKFIKNKKLVVYVFPSLSLIDQFCSDYLDNYPEEHLLRICSENEATTESTQIKLFLSKPTNKIICVTYQSYETLLENLDEIKINVCIFDEAHHAVGETYQKLIFENDICEKQIFFTATPKNSNGIIMYDRENLDAGMCGKLVYDYSYLRGVEDGYLNPIEIRVDMFSENDNKSVYESIARAILASGNSRVLTFHSDVNTERDTSVNNFVNEAEFKRSFREVLEKEFPEKDGYYTDIVMIGLSSRHSGIERKRILNKFDRTPNNRIFVISSCETIGEGIDTKNANMCVFVDPKSSYVKIIQNIGRIVRKQFGVDKPNSTVLIPCWVDKTKYLECDGDKEKCDEVIRQDMDKSGNFNGILNVLSALKQEDEELYDICLHYPDTYSPQEIKSNLEKQGYTIVEQVGEGMLLETMENLLEAEIDYDDYETDEEMIMNIAEDNNVCIEIHTNSLENPVERYNSECESGEVVRIYKSFNEDLEEDIYQPIIKKEKGTKRNSGFINGPKRENRMNMKVHTNPDIKVLWNITSDLDLTKDICSCVIDCEVVDNWYENFEELKKFIDKNGRRPTHRLEIEKKLCNWTCAQIQNYKKKLQAMKDETKYSLWTTFIEEYTEYFKSDDEVWYEKIEQLKLFINENKKKPIMESSDKNQKILGKWLSHQISNYNKKEHGMTDSVKYELWTEFLEEYKDYFKSDYKNWYENLEQVKSFINKNKKRPNSNLKDIEGNLGKWMSRQNNNYKRNIQSMKDETKYNLWSNLLEEYKEYFKSNDEIWYENFEELKIFINENKKRPSMASSDKTIKVLGKWLSHQLNQYKNKKNGMKDETRYNLWTTFLEEYKEYFDNLETQSVASSEVSEQIIDDDEEEFIIIPKPKKSMKLKKPVKKEESVKQKRERVKSEISVLHKRYKGLTSENLHTEFNEQPELWNKYHEISEENEKSFPEDEIPRNKIIQELLKIKTKRTKLVVDMGCGKGQIAEHFKTDKRFQFINYDHISSNDTIISCDISKLPLEEDAVEICILSLAMWGSNCKEYVKEANRILESGGKLYIIEATKRWSEKDDNNNIIEATEGMKLKTLLEKNGFQIVEQSIEKFCLFVCIKI